MNSQTSWKFIQDRERRTFTTLGNGTPFTIGEVDEHHAKLHLTGGHYRNIRRGSIDAFVKALVTNGVVEVSVHQQRDDGHSAYYMAAILSQLPGVVVLMNPLRLKWANVS